MKVQYYTLRFPETWRTSKLWHWIWWYFCSGPIVRLDVSNAVDEAATLDIIRTWLEVHAGAQGVVWDWKCDHGEIGIKGVTFNPLDSLLNYYSASSQFVVKFARAQTNTATLFKIKTRSRNWSSLKIHNK